MLTVSSIWEIMFDIYMMKKYPCRNKNLLLAFN